MSAAKVQVTELSEPILQRLWLGFSFMNSRLYRFIWRDFYYFRHLIDEQSAEIKLVDFIDIPLHGDKPLAPHWQN